jgi:hypothetical protein
MRGALVNVPDAGVYFEERLERPANDLRDGPSREWHGDKCPVRTVSGCSDRVSWWARKGHKGASAQCPLSVAKQKPSALGEYFAF